MASPSKRLSSKTITILKLIAEGYTYEQILSRHPHLTYLDIFAAAREALELAEGGPSDHERRLTEIRRAYPRAYEKWTDKEDERLTALARAGEDVRRIAEMLGRQPSAIRSRMVKLGLMEDETIRGESPV